MNGVITLDDAVRLSEYASSITRSAMFGIGLTVWSDYFNTERTILDNLYAFWSRSQSDYGQDLANQIASISGTLAQQFSPHLDRFRYETSLAELPRFEERIIERLKELRLRQDRPRVWATVLRAASRQAAVRFVSRSRSGTFSKDVRHLRQPIRRDRRHQ